jgi:hypothetical protein
MLSELAAIISAATALGEKSCQDGSRLIGHVPHVAPEAWLHQIFSPLSATGLSGLEQGLGKKVPQQVASHLLEANGCNLFSCSLSIMGHRTNYSRTGEGAIQPFSIIPPNTIERPKNDDLQRFYFGSYDWDGSLVFVTGESNTVYRCDRRSREVTNKWASVSDFISSESDRLATLFDSKGVKLRANQATTPPILGF